MSEPARAGLTGRIWRRFRALPLWLQIIAGLLFLGILVSPFAGQEEGPPTATSTPSPSPSSSPSPTVDTRAQVLDEYLRTNFSSTTWYKHITKVRISSNVAWIETDLFPDPDARKPASAICSGVSSYVFSTSNTIGLTGVTVRAVGGQRLVLRQSISDPC